VRARVADLLSGDPPPGRFGRCILELDAADLAVVRSLVAAVEPILEDGAMVVVFHARPTSSAIATLPLDAASSFAFDVPARLHAVGSAERIRAVNHFATGIRGIRSRRLGRIIAGALHLATGVALARRREVVTSRRPNADWTSITIELCVRERSCGASPRAARPVDAAA
jgi:hypothetical protein